MSRKDKEQNITKKNEEAKLNYENRMNDKR